MEENKEMLELLQKIESNSRRQMVFARVSCIAVVVMMGCIAGIFFLIRDFLPEIAAIVTEIPAVVAQMEVVLENLEVVTENLSAVDFGVMVEGINALVSTGQTGLEETVTKLNDIDFEALNTAIRNLAEVVEPLADFFKVFK